MIIVSRESKKTEYLFLSVSLSLYLSLFCINNAWYVMYLPRGYREHVEDENGDVDKQYSFAILMMTVRLVTKIASFILKTHVLP